MTTLSFSVFTSKENSRNYTVLGNLPNLTFEIDPGMNVASNYASLVFVPAPLTAPQSDSSTNGWTNIDATADAAGIWGLTGTHTDCQLIRPAPAPADNCTFAELQTYLAQEGETFDPQEAVISYSTAFSKGSGDISFSGAVDKLRINNDLYDFEPFGVVKTAIPVS